MKKNSVVVVQFLEGYSKHYHFLNSIEDVQVGDTVVVDTARGITVAEVVDTLPYSSLATKHVIQRVDVEAHEARLKAAKEKAYLEEALRTRQKELEKIARYEELAKNDPVMRKLLDDYNTL